MKKIFLIVLIVLIVLTSFYFFKPVKTICIQPLGTVSPEYIARVKKAIKSFYGYDCVVLPKKQITKEMLTRVTKRIDADRAIIKNLSFDNILIITEKDICYFKDKKSPEYGIFGSGLLSGRTCIISTFRLKRKVTKHKALERLEKVVLHEIGHNLGLDHCVNNKKCMMHDSNGKIKQVDKEKIWFCDKCKKQLN